MIAALAMINVTLSPDFRQWGFEALAMIERDYRLPKSGLYAERPDRKQPAFNWGVGVMLSALNAAAKLDDGYRSRLRSYADATRVYWNEGGYDVLPAPKPKDRYYDDNAWMALALVETHQILGDTKYLKWAEQALDFALEGEAKEGGVYWRESDRASRNTCSNAPTAAACLAVFAVTKDPKRMAKAGDLYRWTKTNLQDPKDLLYWDNLGNGGKIDKTKWTYNTALMIRTALDLKLDDAQAMATAAAKRWLVRDTLDDSGRFAHLLLEALAHFPEHRNQLESALASVHGTKSGSGHYPSHWGKLDVARNPEILDQASFARACLVLANKG